MTFKHVKFEDSVVMRSLEKLAKEKGLVKSEPITKSASKKLEPSTNLTENVLTLCAGLRARGFEKYARDLESKYMALKQAQTLYETSSEKGEDLVDAAHPKGSHKLEDVDGDEAVFETILDQHLKNLKMIEKTPTGKLASTKDILGAVRVVLGQAMPPIPDDPQSLDEEGIAPFRRYGALAQLKQIPNVLSKARDIIRNKMNTTTLAGSFESDYNAINNKINGLNLNNVTVKDVDEVFSSLDSMQNSLKLFSWKDLAALTPGGLGVLPTAVRHIGDAVDIATGNWDSQLRDQIMGVVNTARQYANTARANIRGANDAAIKTKLVQMKTDQAGQAAQQKQEEDKKKEETQYPEITQFKSRVAGLIALLGRYKRLMSGSDFTDNDRAQMIPKIDGKVSELARMQQEFNSFADDKETQQLSAKKYLGKLPAYDNWANKLNTWMNS